MFSTFALSAVTAPRLLSFRISRKLALGVLACCLASITLADSTHAIAATVTKTTNDGFGNDGFAAALGWSDALAPHSGSNYLVEYYDIRTPPSAGSFTFGGDSLTVADGGRILYKGGATTDVITVNNFILDAGVIRNAQGTNFSWAGNINVTANGGLIWDASGGGQNSITANISGGGGTLGLGGSELNASGGIENLSGVNTFTGTVALLGGTAVGSSAAPTVRLSSNTALNAGMTLRFGAYNSNVNFPNASLDLNGTTNTIGGLAVASYSAASAVGTMLPTPMSNPGKITVHFASLPAGIQVGQQVNANIGTSRVTLIDYSTNDIQIGENGSTGLNTNPIPFTFVATTVNAASQTITNSNTTTPATLIFAGGPVASTWGGVITQANTAAATNLTVASGSLTLSGANSYNGNTTLTGGTLSLNFVAATSSTNIINNAANNSALNLGGGTLAVTGKAVSTNSQRFNGATLSGSSAIQLTAAATNSLSVSLGAITRNGTTSAGTVDITNPSGTLSATNGVLTTSGSASQVLTDASGSAYATVGGVDWAAKDASNSFIVALPAVGTYTNSTATTLSGNANVVTNVALSGSTTVPTLRFNSGSQTISGGTLIAGGILMTANSGASAINGGTLEGTAGGDLTLIQYNTAANLSIGSAIANNGSATALDKSGAGTVVLSGADAYSGGTNITGGLLQFAKSQALPGTGTVTVNSGATLGLNVNATGANGEFTPANVASILGSATFQNGASIGIDTTNAGGSLTYSSVIANAGSNAVGLNKLGAGTLVLGAVNTYTGPTTVSSGTLQLGAAGSGSISTSSPVVLGNVTGATFDLNSNATTLYSLSGGGSTGGVVTLGSANLTIGGGVTAIFAGAISGTGGLDVTSGSVQKLTGTPGYTGSTTVNTGSLSLSSSGSSSVGSAASNVSIAPNSADHGNLTVGTGVTLTANNLLVGSVDTLATTGGVGTLNQTGGSTVAGNVFLGSSGTFANPAQGTINLTGGTLTAPAIMQGGGTTGQARVNFNGGTLQATALSNPTIFIDPTITTSVQAGGAIIDTNGNSFSISNNFVHDTSGPAIDGGFNKVGIGSLTLSGANSFTGVTAVSGGTLVLQSANAVSSGYAANAASSILDVSGLTAPFSVAANQTIQGTGTIMGSGSGFSHIAGVITGGVSTVANSTGTLTFAGGPLDLNGGTVRFDLSNSSAGSNDKIIDNVGLTASGSSIIDLEFASKPAGADVYTLFQYGGSALSPAQQANFVVVGNGGRGVALDFGTAGLVKLDFTNVPSGTLTWNSSSNPNWDTNPTDTNWFNSTPTTAHDRFANGDSVTFDDTGTVTGVTIGSQVAPSSFTVSTSSKSYTFSGAGKITGSTSLVKNGSTSLTLATSNDYQGGTTINDNGKIIVADTASTSSTSGTGTGPVTVTTNATLQIGNGTSGAGTVLGTIHDNGSVVLNRPDATTLANSIDGTGAVTLQGGNTVVANASAGAFALSYSGNTNITSGTLQAGAANTLPFNSTVVLANAANSTLDLNGNGSAVGGIAGGGTSGGVVNASADLTFSGSTTSTFNGTLNAGGNSIIANGSQSMVQNLNGTINGFTGVTTVSNGTLNFNPSGATPLGSSSSAVNLAAAANNVGTLGIGQNATLNASAITVGANDGSNGNGTLNVTAGGSVLDFGALNIGNNGGTGAVNVTGGSLNVATNIVMATNGSGASATITVGAGGMVNTLGTVTIGSFFNPASTINVNGGNFTMSTDTNGTPNPSGTITLQNNNAANWNAVNINLNSGVLTTGSITVTDTDTSATPNFNLQVTTGSTSRLPNVNFNGGTLRAAGDSSGFINPAGTGSTGTATTYQGAVPFNFSVQAGGGTFDPAGHNVTINASITNGTSGTKDGGFTVNDSGGGSGIVTLASAGSTFNGGLNVVKGTVMAGAAAVPAQTVAATVTAASTTITLPGVVGLAIGQTVSGGGLPAGTVISSIPSATTVTLSNTLAASASLTFGGTSAPGAGRLNMAGGTLNTGGFNQSLTALKLNANSTLDLNAGNSGETFGFGDSSTQHWIFGANNGVLTVANWNGTGNPAGTDPDQIVFPTATSLNGNELSQIQFAGSGNQYSKLVQLTGGPNSGQFELAPSATLPTGIMTLGDVNQDGVVNVKDVSALMAALANLSAYQNGTTSIRSGGAWTASQLIYTADVNRDDVVDNRDVQALINYIANGLTGGGGSLTAVPEPTSIVLGALGALALAGVALRKRNRSAANQ